jgi:hypothetical protein
VPDKLHVTLGDNHDAGLGPHLDDLPDPLAWHRVPSRAEAHHPGSIDLAGLSVA